MNNENEARLIENTARLDKVEKTLALLIERLDCLNSLENNTPALSALPSYDLEDLRLNPYAILCRMASQEPKREMHRH